jgi:hypothetical protein
MKDSNFKQDEITDDSQIGLSAKLKGLSNEEGISHEYKDIKISNPNKPTLILGGFEQNQNNWGDDEARDEIYQLG